MKDPLPECGVRVQSCFAATARDEAPRRRDVGRRGANNAQQWPAKGGSAAPAATAATAACVGAGVGARSVPLYATVQHPGHPEGFSGFSHWTQSAKSAACAMASTKWGGFCAGMTSVTATNGGSCCRSNSPSPLAQPELIISRAACFPSCEGATLCALQCRGLAPVLGLRPVIAGLCNT